MTNPKNVSSNGSLPYCGDLQIWNSVLHIQNFCFIYICILSPYNLFKQFKSQISGLWNSLSILCLGHPLSSLFCLIICQFFCLGPHLPTLHPILFIGIRIEDNLLPVKGSSSPLQRIIIFLMPSRSSFASKPKCAKEMSRLFRRRRWDSNISNSTASF